MKITIRVKAGARRNSVTPLGSNTFMVSVTAPPHEGQANEKVVEVLSEYFGRPKRSISILKGATSRIKLVEIAD